MSSAKIDPERPILMLVPHEPDLDPRIKWLTDLCAKISRVDIIAFKYLPDDKPTREYDGVIYTERVYLDEFKRLTKFYRLAHKLGHKLVELIEWLIGKKIKPQPLESPPEESGHGQEVEPQYPGNPPKDLEPDIIHSTLVALYRKILALRWKIMTFWITKTSFLSFQRISKVLYWRAKAGSIPPRLIICHDLSSLAAGVELKNYYKCPLIYDFHEFYPEIWLQGKWLHRKFTVLYEKRLIRQADLVVTVSSPLAHHLEKLYGISNVISIPNAEPLSNDMVPSCMDPGGLPVKFLYQGNICQGRGIDKLFEAWSKLNNEKAVLLIRGPENDYYASLRNKYQRLFEEGRIRSFASVTEAELITAASNADVGVIPYTGPNLNHVYACPNKLSQYMQAGLAILNHSDQQFVSEMVRLHQCGVSYNFSNPRSLHDAVQFLVDNLDKLQVMKCNAYNTAQSIFNWTVQSKEYQKAIGLLYERGIGRHERRT